VESLISLCSDIHQAYFLPQLLLLCSTLFLQTLSNNNAEADKQYFKYTIMHINKFIVSFCIIVSFVSCSNDPIDALYQKKTPEERVAQLSGMYVAKILGPDGHLDTLKAKELIPNGIGHFSQYASNTEMSADELRDLVAEVQDWLINHTPSGIPALFHEEALSGVAAKGATQYPQQIGLACSFNPELAEIKTQQTAASLRKIGGMLALSPMVDVCRTPSFNRLEESYGEDAYLSAAMGTAFVRGLQDGGLKNGIAGCSKHFLGYGGGGDAPQKELMEDILMPHETMIRLGGSKVVMTGYHTFHGVRAVANSELMQDILRDYLKFDGLMVSDYSSLRQIPDLDSLHQAAAAINAGNDVEFPDNSRYSLLLKAVEQGLVSEETFERAVKRVLKLKSDLGLLDKNPVLYAEGHIEFDSFEERNTAYQLATQSVVLLKNSGVLPLKDFRKMAVTGPNANSMWAMLGDYSYPGMAYFWHRFNPSSETPHISVLLEGLQSRKPEGLEITYKRGCDWTDSSEVTIEKGGDIRAMRLMRFRNRRLPGDEPADRKGAIKMASEADVIIAAMGENDLLCGENRDRGSLRLPGSQEDYVRELIATGKPVVLVVFGGRAQVLGDLVDKCAAVIQAWYPEKKEAMLWPTLFMATSALPANLA
jgi:beta-glucosidase